MQKQIVYRPCPTADLKELEINGFVKRVVHAQAPVVLEYQLTPYADTLSGVLESLSDWRAMHRNKLRSER